MTDFVTLFLVLAAGHYLADYPLQGEFVAKMKGQPNPDGRHTLAAHASIQGLVAAAIAQHLGYDGMTAGVIVAVTHWFIDLGKARMGYYGLDMDQALHMLVMLGVTALLVLR